MGGDDHDQDAIFVENEKEEKEEHEKDDKEELEEKDEEDNNGDEEVETGPSEESQSEGSFVESPLLKVKQPTNKKRLWKKGWRL